VDGQREGIVSCRGVRIEFHHEGDHNALPPKDIAGKLGVGLDGDRDISRHQGCPDKACGVRKVIPLNDPGLDKLDVNEPTVLNTDPERCLLTG